MEELFTNISAELLIIISVNLVLIFIMFILYISVLFKYKKLKVKYDKFMSGLSDRNIEDLLDNCMQKLDVVSEKSREMENHINSVERELMKCIQKVGIIRFNAFDNVGSDLSFSIALLDVRDNGVVLSGIYSRESSSTYAKPIISGKSKYTLSAEEIQAIDIAKKSNMERLYTEK